MGKAGMGALSYQHRPWRSLPQVGMGIGEAPAGVEVSLSPSPPWLTKPLRPDHAQVGRGL